MTPEENAKNARDRLKAKFGKGNRMGGKGSMRIRKKTKGKKKNNEDKAITGLVSKLNAQKLPDISNVNLFTDDDKVISFQQPMVYGSFQNKTLICTGNSTTKDIKDCFADVISELPPAQLERLKKENIIPETEPEKKEENDKKPELANFEEESQKQLI